MIIGIENISALAWQNVLLGCTLVALIFYAIETWKIRKSMERQNREISRQLKVMQESLAFQQDQLQPVISYISHQIQDRNSKDCIYHRAYNAGGSITEVEFPEAEGCIIEMGEPYHKWDRGEEKYLYITPNNADITTGIFRGVAFTSEIGFKNALGIEQKRKLLFELNAQKIRTQMTAANGVPGTDR